jgi:hypothetical protein
VNYALADLLLTRGNGEVNERDFAAEIDSVPMGQDEALQIYVIEKIGRLALTEQGDVKSSACELLWIFTQDRVRGKTVRAAADALHKASCDCAMKPKEAPNVQCP